MTNEELLDAMGDTFVEKKVGQLLNITFEQFIEHPAYYEGLADAMDCGHGLQLSEAGNLVAVELGNRI